MTRLNDNEQCGALNASSSTNNNDSSSLPPYSDVVPSAAPSTDPLRTTATISASQFYGKTLKHTYSSRDISKSKDTGPSVGPGSSHTSYQFSSNLPSYDEDSALSASRRDSDVRVTNVTHVSPLTSEPLEDYRPPEPVYETTYNTDWLQNSPTWNPGGHDLPVVQVRKEDWLTDPPVDWWDVKNSTYTPSRPGPGQLPALLAANILDEPLFQCDVASIPSPPEPRGGIPVTDPRYPASSLEDARSCLPKNLYYNFKSHGWVFVNVAQEEVLSVPLHEISDRPFPSDVGRALYGNCMGRPEFKRPAHEDISVHHHFHHYPRATDVPPSLSTAFSPPGNLASESSASTPMDQDANEPGIVEITKEIVEQDADTIPADLYICTLCQIYVMASDVIPAVIPSQLLRALVLDRTVNPPVGKSSAQSVVCALELLVKIMTNCLFKGQGNAVNLQATGLLNSLGWNETTAKIFGSIGFRNHHDLPMRLAPPSFSSSVHGSRNREIMTRAWIEINAWLLIYKESRAFDVGSSRDGPYIRISPFKEEFEMLVGSHINQGQKRTFLDSLPKYARNAFLHFGMTPESYSEKLLEFAFSQQIRCDPNRIPQYLAALEAIGRIPNLPSRQDLTDFIMTQKSRGFWSEDDLHGAVTLLGFGENRPLGISFDSDVDGDFLIGAFRNAWAEIDARTANDSMFFEKRDTERRDLKEALVIASQRLGINTIVERANQEIDFKSMTTSDAYGVFDATKEVDDDTLIVVYEMRVGATEQPGEVDKLRMTMQFIAEDRNSDRLRRFLETGVDPGQGGSSSHRPEWPRGLHQLGNTCYLNSLLQYFYTIRDLRDALAAGSFRSGTREEDFKGKPIGGRLISSRELDRSRRFVTHLHSLFINLAHAETPAVLPELELAKLALMTSKDEEMASGAQETAATSIGSAETDSTLVEANGNETINPQDIPLPPSHQNSLMLPASMTVLGKRSGESRITTLQEPPSPMDVDESPLPKRRQTSGEIGSSSYIEATTAAEDTEMTDAAASKATPAASSSIPPPLPPRNRQPSVGDMMFGRQNDVSECMDNCIFQIEAALQFDLESGEESDKPNVVKRLFYGSKRQRITLIDEDGKAQAAVSEKTDLFAHLLVNVSDEGTDIYDGLSGFMDDTVEFEGKKASMEVVLVETPPILQIQLQRVQFDRETMQARKNNAHVKFGETLYLDRFMQSATSEKRMNSAAIQKELQRCRERLAVLTGGSNETILDSLAQSQELIRDLLQGGVEEIDQSLVDYLGNEKTVVQQEVHDCRSRVQQLKAELEELWSDERNEEYELSSVFIHRGTSPAWGHYFFYSRDLPSNPDSWFKYNDSEVSVVSKDEVLADGTGSTANAYLLVYARKGSNVIDTVHRIIPP